MSAYLLCPKCGGRVYAIPGDVDRVGPRPASCCFDKDWTVKTITTALLLTLCLCLPVMAQKGGVQYFRALQDTNPTPGVVFDSGQGGCESVAIVWDFDDKPIVVRDGDFISEHPDFPSRYRVFRNGIEVVSK